MIALAVIAIALAALVNSASTQLRIFERTREKTIAGWVASNVLVQMQLRDGFPEPGERTGTEKMAERRFTWRARIQSTVDSNLRRIDLSLYPEVQNAEQPSGAQAKSPILTRTAFAARK
jgi:general secretion pathway protein I